MTNTNDVMTRARQALAGEEAARLEAKAAELATADERARREAEKEAKRQQATAAAADALAGVSLPKLAEKFDAAVAALVELAQAAEHRNRTIQQQAALLTAADVPENRGRGGNGLVLNGETHSTSDLRELLARAAALAANQVGTPANGVQGLASGLLPYSGPLFRTTPVERVRRP